MKLISGHVTSETEKPPCSFSKKKHLIVDYTTIDRF